jgi:deoxyribodipyrimidine photo-lyase
MSRLSSSPCSATPATLFLFTRDLRLDDHAGLNEAAKSGEIVPVLVLDTHRRERLALCAKRTAFFCHAVRALAEALAARGSVLIVRRGSLGPTVVRLAREAGAGTVVWSWAYDAAGVAEQRALQSSLEEAGLRAVGVHDAPVVAPDDTAATRSNGGGTGYRAFTAYYANWSRAPRASYARKLSFAPPGPLSSEALPQPHEFGSAADVAWNDPSAQFERFVENGVLQYATMRHVPAIAGTSRLAAHLSFGTISARAVLARVEQRAAEPFLLTEEGLSLRAFTRGLAQRDFFLQLAWFFQERRDDVLQARMRSFRFARSHPALDAWREGRTGYPLVDAGMRELAATGWMHPHVRLVAASFLCFDLGVDWRVGRDTWDRALIEDDPALATGNWQWAAGVGADLAQYPRIFNPVRQAQRFDPACAYVRRWVPELATVPDADVLDPLGARRRAQLALPLFDAEAYPEPLVDHGEAARAFLRRYARHVQGSGSVPG